MTTVNRRRTIRGASPLPNSLDHYEAVVRVLLDDPTPSRTPLAPRQAAAGWGNRSPVSGRDRQNRTRLIAVEILSTNRAAEIGQPRAFQ